MLRTAFVLIVMNSAYACSSASDAAHDVTTSSLPAVATVTIRNIAPAAGEQLKASSVLQATVDYSINNFDPAAVYYLAPLFDSTKGENVTFNYYQQLTDAERISRPSGSLQFRYAIRNEWQSGQLKQPVRVRFALMVRTGASTTKVIGKSEAVEFARPSNSAQQPTRPASWLSASAPRALRPDASIR